MLALGGCVSALALPAAAAAQPAQYTPPTGSAPTPITYHPHGRPAAFAGSTTPSVVVREVHTITQGSDHTLALVLASAALGVALCGTAFAVVRTARIQRRVLGNNS